MKLIKGDTIKVVAGKDKGKTGKIEIAYTKEAKVLVAGVNEYKRHQKGGGYDNTRSEIITITKPLPVANVQLVCPHCKKLTRIGYSMEKDKKVRVCRKCGKAL